MQIFRILVDDVIFLPDVLFYLMHFKSLDKLVLQLFGDFHFSINLFFLGFFFYSKYILEDIMKYYTFIIYFFQNWTRFELVGNQNQFPFANRR